MDEKDSPIFVRYDCTKRERRQGVQLLTPRAKNTRQPDVGRGLLGWLLFVAVAAILFVWLKNSSPAGPAKPRASGSLDLPTLIGFGASAVGAVLWVGSFVVLIASQRAQARRWKGLQTFSFDEQGFTFGRPGRTDTYRWSKFRGFEEGPDVFVIRSSATTGDILPKRLFTDQELERFRGILQRNLTRAVIPLAHGFEVTRP